MLVEGKTAIITGAASGIGRATALAFTREGARTVLADIDGRGLEETVELARSAGGEVTSQTADVTRLEDHMSLVELAQASFGRLDAACNVAGILGGAGANIPDLDTEDWDRVLAVNLTGTFYALKAQIPVLIAAGGGAIVNVASVVGVVGAPGASAYAATKHGVVGLTKSAALECAETGVRINAVGPGLIDTPIGNTPRTRAGIAAGAQPIGRFGRPEEVAEMIVWLCSDRASLATGGFFPIDGGFTAR